MSWEWNASAEGGEYAYQHIHRMKRDDLCACLAEFAANEKQPDDWEAEDACCDSWDEYRRFSSTCFDEEEYERVYAELKGSCLVVETLADTLWSKVEDWATCDNEGFRVHVCPFGCHTVSLDCPAEEEDDAEPQRRI